MIRVKYNSFAGNMEITCEKIDHLRQMREEVMALEGSLPSVGGGRDNSVRLGPMEKAFPEGAFPLGVNHEFISSSPSEAASAQGFMAAILGMLLNKGGYCLWIGNRRHVFPPALRHFGIMPHNVIFVDVKTEKEVLWTLEQALKCNALVAVVGELRELDFAGSQRLQLAVERSRVTGFLHRHLPRGLHALACNTRWKINPLTSRPEEGMPGLGFPVWNIELLKVRNGKPGAWELEWSGNEFRQIPREEACRITEEERRYG